MLKEHIVNLAIVLNAGVISDEPSWETTPGVSMIVFLICLVLTITAMFFFLTASAWRQRRK